MVEEEVRKADCLIVGAPVYVLQPVGQFKNFDKYINEKSELR